MSSKEQLLHDFKLHAFSRTAIIGSMILCVLCVATIWVLPPTQMGAFFSGILLYGVIFSIFFFVIALIVSLHTGKKLFKAMVPLADRFDELIKQEAQNNPVTISDGTPITVKTAEVKVTNENQSK